MMIKFKIAGRITGEEATETKLGKNVKLGGSTRVYKTKLGYLLCHCSYAEQVNVVFEQSKRLSDLKLSIDPENAEWIRVELSNEEHQTTYGVRVPIPTPEAYKFEAGEEIANGKILARSDDYQFYYVKSERIDKNTGEMKTNYTVVHWHNAFNTNEAEPFEVQHSDLRYYSSCISSLYTKLFRFGLDLDPEYQRGKVWNEEQKVALIDSIFKGIPIGAIVIATKKWHENGQIIGDMEEVVDGKQRIVAILDFISGKFKYNGLFFHEMSAHNRCRFDNSNITMGELGGHGSGGEYDKEKILKTFIALNVGGTSMGEETIVKAKSMLAEMKEEK